ncbi:hypothetical protein JNO63_07395 [Anaerococcus sp. mt242]|uniref:tellurite resistance TerB C-terminal domain-containing protein n=1 Tax=Anaerococcus sp. mt242 TaxID=2661917 RepID=UPI00193319F8|nr:tellurite resistance TerB C-terminal domain-containing protein [Anaerococcus sp. mt242]MBM0046916.1 hypothetical protein [Anaerococcus sp. mt242]
MKYEDIKNMIDNIAKDISKLQKGEKQSFKRKIEAGDMNGIIDISLDKEEKIPKKLSYEKPIIKDYRYWILKLDRQYKSKDMRINQLNVAALKMYAKLCETLEIYLNKEGTTFARKVSSLRRESVNFDLYYTIYLIAESYVINFYNPLSKKSADRSFKIIEKNISLEAKELIKNQAEKLAGELKTPDKNTREYFKLTENNQVSLWWDPNGTLRKKYNFTKEEQLAIDQISKRSNVLWRNQKVFKILMDLYLSTLRALFDYEEISTDKLIKIIKPYHQSKDILDAILVISEKNLREKFSFYGWISTDKARDLLKEESNEDIYNFVKKYQSSYLNKLDSKLVDEIYRNYFDNNPNKIQDFIYYFANLKIVEKIEFIKDFEKKENFQKILTELIKSWYEEDKIIALYYLYKMRTNKKSHEKYLFEIIHKENYVKFLNLVKEEELSEKLIDKIISLEKLAPKKIRVDSKKINLSRKNLDKTVSMVNDFFEEDQDFDEEIVENITSESKTNNYNDILKNILKNGFIKTEELESIAKNEGLTLNTFVGNINESLFDYVEDQTLIIENQKVIIDEFYVDMIKEYVDGK